MRLGMDPPAGCAILVFEPREFDPGPEEPLRMALLQEPLRMVLLQDPLRMALLQWMEE